MTGPNTGVAIVSPGHPHSPGGVTDHTSRLIRHWSASGRRVLVLSEPKSGDIRPRIEQWRTDGIRAVLIQYVPFLYARRGLSHFPERLARAARAAGIRVVTFVHEPWVPPTRLPWIVLSPLQRRQLLRLLPLCDGVATAVPGWQDRLRCDVEIVYVGSTLSGQSSTAASGEPLPAPVVFSPFAAGLRWDWIAAAAGTIGTEPALVVVGAKADQARRHHIVGDWFDETWDWRGYQPEETLLPLLARARLVLAPFTDGLTGRRTSALAAASTGTQLILSSGPLLDRVFLQSPVVIADTKEEFAQTAARLWNSTEDPVARRERLSWYSQHFDAERLDRRLLEIVMG